jgi:hypothetical protein
MKVITTLSLQTVNRGVKLFTISEDEKRKYFAHEIGGLTQFAKVTGKDQLTAHRLNPTIRRGNRYGRYLKPLGMKTIIQAKRLCREQANTHVIYSNP